MSTYVVTAPYVTLRIKDNNTGSHVLTGYYAGATVPEDVHPVDLDRHLQKGMVSETGTDQAELLGVPAGTPVPGEPPNVPVTEQPAVNLPTEERLRRATEAAAGTDARPKDYASKAAWVDYAVAQRSPDVSEENARAEAEALTKPELVARYGGFGAQPDTDE
jgi:hypothetical protein